MGDIADMMLDGTLCQVCGCFVGDAVGYPQTCDDCAKPEKPRRFQPRRKSAFKGDAIACPKCGRKVAKTGLEQHIAAKHPLATIENKEEKA
jgi:hypothetical protein